MLVITNTNTTLKKKKGLNFKVPQHNKPRPSPRLGPGSLDQPRPLRVAGSPKLCLASLKFDDAPLTLRPSSRLSSPPPEDVSPYHSALLYPPHLTSCPPPRLPSLPSPPIAFLYVVSSVFFTILLFYYFLSS